MKITQIFCVDLIQPLMRAFFDENFEEVTKITKKNRKWSGCQDQI